MHGVAEIITALAWPLAAIIIAASYRGTAKALVAAAKLKLTISGVTVELTPRDIEATLRDALHGRHLTEEDWGRLARLRKLGRSALDHSIETKYRPLRDAGLIRVHPEGFLAQATDVELTHLGTLLVDHRTALEATSELTGNQSARELSSTTHTAPRLPPTGA
jgi:DNA-binding transcriptional ArsR family regulator